jgi:hypothetical protein
MSRTNGKRHKKGKSLESFKEQSIEPVEGKDSLKGRDAADGCVEDFPYFPLLPIKRVINRIIPNR